MRDKYLYLLIVTVFWMVWVVYGLCRGKLTQVTLRLENIHLLLNFSFVIWAPKTFISLLVLLPKLQHVCQAQNTLGVMSEEQGFYIEFAFAFFHDFNFSTFHFHRIFPKEKQCSATLRKWVDESQPVDPHKHPVVDLF